MLLTIDLTATWQHIVDCGEIQNVFTDVNGRSIEAGLRMTVHGPEHYAIDLATGRETEAGVSQRTIDGSNFTLQWNPYRSLKPKVRALGLGRQQNQSPAAADCLFACQDPSRPASLLRRSAALQVTLRNQKWAAFYNLLPVEKEGHFLWIPVTIKGRDITLPHVPQTLTLPLLQDFLSLALMGKDTFTLFNSMHAGGSVNHIHFHSVSKDGPAPIESASTFVCGNRCLLHRYPASGLVYANVSGSEAIWRDVATLQEHQIPYNLIHTAGCTYLIPRNAEQEVIAEFPNGVLAGMELLGKAITTEREFFDTADQVTIEAALTKSTMRNEDFLALLGRSGSF